MILESKAPSTEGFSSDWNSSCSISLIRSWLRVSKISKTSHCAPSNISLCSEGGEQFLHDIILVQLGPDILEGDITKPSQTDLSEGVIDEHSPEGCETNLFYQAIDGLGRARPCESNAGKWNSELSRILWRVPFIRRVIILGLPSFGGGYTLRAEGGECDVTGVHEKEYSTPAAQKNQ